MKRSTTGIIHIYMYMYMYMYMQNAMYEAKSSEYGWACVSRSCVHVKMQVPRFDAQACPEHASHLALPQLREVGHFFYFSS